MYGPSIHNVKLEHQTTLRQEAEALIKEGAAKPMLGWLPGINALSMLYDLARAPETAGDALKFLHELQVHQVELDLQHEQMEENRSELVEELTHYVALYDFAPVGYFTVDSSDKIIECNRAGASLLGVACAELSGRRLDSFLAPASGLVLLALLKRLRSGSYRETCAVKIDSGEGVSRDLQVVASLSPSNGYLLLVLMDTSDHQGLDPHI
jgi:PAS domain S-box-containing protein